MSKLTYSHSSRPLGVDNQWCIQISGRSALGRRNGSVGGAGRAGLALQIHLKLLRTSRISGKCGGNNMLSAFEKKFTTRCRTQVPHAFTRHLLTSKPPTTPLSSADAVYISLTCPRIAVKGVQWVESSGWSNSENVINDVHELGLPFAGSACTAPRKGLD